MYFEVVDFLVELTNFGGFFRRCHGVSEQVGEAGRERGRQLLGSQ
jgi:hypothetical protein